MATEERRWRRGLGRDREEEGLCNTRLVRLRFDDDADGADERARAPSSDRSSSGRGASRTARRGRAGDPGGQARQEGDASDLPIEGRRRGG